MSSYFLCHKKDIANYQTKGFTVETDQGQLELLLLRQENQVNAYQNNCPHLGIPLNWQPDKFLSLEETHIQCSTHGALFTLEEGLCIAGPCAGQKLTSLLLEQRDDDEIWLQLNPTPRI